MHIYIKTIHHNFTFMFQDITTGQSILDVVFRYLNLIETAYFGLRYLDEEGQTVSIRVFNYYNQLHIQ